MPPQRGSKIFFIFPGVTLLRSSTPGYHISPLAGALEFRSQRSHACVSKCKCLYYATLNV